LNKNITVEEILKATNGTLIYGNKLEECESFSKNTKEIKDGDVYIGFKGERFDGGKFYEDALKNGAKGAIINKIDGLEIKRLENKFVIQVDDTVEAVGQIAKLKREKYNIPVIAITGSVGKTSTKDIIYSVVSQKYNALKTQGNMNNHIGMPMTILGLREHEALVVEMGMNHFGELSKLTAIAKPTIAVITNVGTAHIGNLGSRENILKAKLEILEGLQQGGTAVINNDNDLLHKWYEENKEKIEKTYTQLNLGLSNEEFIVLCVGANKVSFKINGKYKSNDVKNWPIENWIVLANSLNKENIRVVLVGGKNDIKKIIDCKERLDNSILNLVGRMNIAESISILEYAKMVVGCDTGLMHCAASLNKRTLMLLGGITPIQAQGYGKNSESIYLHKQCSPCFGTGKDVFCNDPVCMKEISVENVLERILNIC